MVWFGESEVRAKQSARSRLKNITNTFINQPESIALPMKAIRK
ncbi:MAG: hypothetical protein [Olavius algarvensis Delta 4 endosymbiont]|nr:MAG: hypothetical protein [Olavius algarvensis Delta 4 endosymbiont]